MKTSLIATVVVAGVASASFGQVPWTNPSGSNGNFSWSNGQSDNGLFGSPLVTPTGFLFTPDAFNANANDADGLSQITTDTLSVVISPDADFAITGIRITELGNYNINGEGSVEANATLTASQVGGGFNVSDTMDTAPLFPVSQTAGTTSDNWNGLAEVFLPVTGSDILIEVQNNMIAIAAPGSTAFISKIVVGGQFSVQLIPAPATVGFLGLGALAMGRRRR